MRLTKYLASHLRHFWQPVRSRRAEKATPTFVVVLVIAAILLERHGTVDAVPAVVATAFPETFAADAALAVARAAAGTPFDRTVLAVPSRHAETSAVLALAVLVAARVAQLHVAILAAPSIVARARLADASPVLPAVHVAQFCRGESKCIVRIEPLETPVAPTTNLLSNRHRSISPRSCTSGCPSRTFRDRCNRASTVTRPGP